MSEVDLFGDPVDSIKKQCIYCGESKTLDKFPKKLDNFDGYDNRCTACKSERSKQVDRLRKVSPPMANSCQVCGVKPGDLSGRKVRNLCLDHDPETGVFRGWLCGQCNTAIGHLGDSASGVYKAFYYLLDTLTEEKKIKLLKDIIDIHPKEDHEYLLSTLKEIGEK